MYSVTPNLNLISVSEDPLRAVSYRTVQSWTGPTGPMVGRGRRHRLKLERSVDDDHFKGGPEVGFGELKNEQLEEEEESDFDLASPTASWMEHPIVPSEGRASDIFQSGSYSLIMNGDP